MWSYYWLATSVTRRYGGRCQKREESSLQNHWASPSWKPLPRPATTLMRSEVNWWCHYDVITRVLSLQAFEQLARLILKKVSYFNLYSNCKTSLNLFSKEPCCKHFTILIQDMRPRPIRVWCYNHWVKTWILIYVYSCTVSCTWSCNVNSAEEHILQLCSGDRGISRIFVILRLAAPCTHRWLHTLTCPVHAYTL